MTENKMTEEEIMKALECCTQNTKCPACPMWNTGQNCMNRLYQYALDLINRKNAEIEEWKKNCDELYKEMSERQKAEVEIAKRMGRSEAIKEFAKRMKMFLLLAKSGDMSVLSFDDIERLVKEMGVEL